MKDVTVQELCKLEHLNQGELALEINVSQAAVSKIKTNTIPISNEIQFNVNQRFEGEYRLVNKVSRPQDHYYNRKDKYYELQDKYNAKVAECSKLKTEKAMLVRELKSITKRLDDLLAKVEDKDDND